MSAETTLQRVMSILGMAKESQVQVEMTKEPKVEVQLAQKKTADEQAVFESENFAIGEAVSIVTADGMVPVPEGEYTLEDGMEIKVDANGVIVEVGMPEEVEAKDDAMMEKDEEEMGKDKMGNYPKKKMESTPPKKVVKSKTEMEESYFASQLEQKVADLEIKLSALQSENAELMQRLNTEEAPRTKFSPEASVETKQIFKLGAKRQETVEDRIYNQLF